MAEVCEREGARVDTGRGQGHHRVMAAYPPPDLRVSDGEREPIVERLRQAFVEGRLGKDEFDQRLTLALTARTHADIAPVLAGLPVPEAPEGNPPSVDERPAADERTAAAFAHLLGGATSFVGPLIMVVAAKNGRTGFSRAQAVEALNFQLSLLMITIVTLGIGSLLYAVAWIFSIVAAVNAGSGLPFRYPFTWRLVR